MTNEWYRASQERIHATGITHNNADGTSRQMILRQYKRRPDGELELVRDSENAVDPNAIAIFCEFEQIGYVPKELAEVWAPKIDSGKFRFTVGYRKVSEFTGDNGRQIVSVTFDVDEWRRDTKPRKSKSQPPAHRDIEDAREQTAVPVSPGLVVCAILIVFGLVAWWLGLFGPGRTARRIGNVPHALESQAE